MRTEKASCFVHDEYDGNCPWCKVEHRRAKNAGEYLPEEDSIKPEPKDPRDEEVMVEDWRTVQEVKEALGLRGEPFHAEVEGNGVKFVYPQLKNDVEEGGQIGND